MVRKSNRVFFFSDYCCCLERGLPRGRRTPWLFGSKIEANVVRHLNPLRRRENHQIRLDTIDRPAWRAALATSSAACRSPEYALLEQGRIQRKSLREEEPPHLPTPLATNGNNHHKKHPTKQKAIIPLWDAVNVLITDIRHVTRY